MKQSREWHALYIVGLEWINTFVFPTNRFTLGFENERNVVGAQRLTLQPQTT
jgi:hypothetical protein